MISIEQATQTRLALLRAGFCPLPFACKEKRPVIRNWQRLDASISEACIIGWQEKYPNATGTGVLAGHLTVVDVDVTKPELIQPIKAAIHKITGGIAPERIGCPPKRAFFFRSENPMRKKVSKRFGSELVQDQQIEILGQGQCVVTHNVHPSTNQLYLWPNVDLVNCTLDSLPKINQSQVNDIISAAEEIMSEAGLVSKQDIKNRDKIVFSTMKHSGYEELSTEQMRDILGHIPNHDRHYDDWLRICFALNAWGGEGAAQLFDEWSAKSPKNVKAVTQQKFLECTDPHSVTVGTIIYEAMQCGYRFPKRHGKTVVNLMSGDTENRVFLHSGKLHSSVSEIEKFMSDSDLNFYQFNGQLIEIIDSEAQDDNINKHRLITHDKASLRDRLGLVVQPMKYSQKTGEWYPVNAPAEILDALLSRGINSKLEQLKTIATTAYLSPENELVTKLGYDAKSRVYLVKSGAIVAGQSCHPSKQAALKSLGFLRRWLSDFPFKSGVDESVALACLMAAADRVNLDNIPLTVFNAPTAGTGKSLLVDVIGVVSSGKPVSVLSQGKDEAEMEKRLHSAVLRGDTLINIDNVEQPLGGDVLCQILTQPVLRVRPLGVSKLLDVEKSCQIVATGNNLELSGDVVRRSLICNLDAGVERPELRTFKYDARKRALDQRHDIVDHVLTIIKSYLLHSAHEGPSALGSFERWSSRIRNPLVWLGMVDPCISQEQIRQNDTRLEAHTGLLTILNQCFPDVPFKAREILSLPMQIYQASLIEHLNTLGCYTKGTIDVTRVGRVLKKMEGRVLADLLLKQAGRSGGTVTWIVDKHDAELGSGG